MNAFATVTDTNHKPRGVMAISMVRDSSGPVLVTHAGSSYGFTGKAGTNFRTGCAVREMSTQEIEPGTDSRLWVSMDGSKIWED